MADLGDISRTIPVSVIYDSLAIAELSWPDVSRAIPGPSEPPPATSDTPGFVSFG